MVNGIEIVKIKRLIALAATAPMVLSADLLYLSFDRPSSVDVSKAVNVKRAEICFNLFKSKLEKMLGEFNIFW
jgi:hypothetical protein